MVWTFVCYVFVNIIDHTTQYICLFFHHGNGLLKMLADIFKNIYELQNQVIAIFTDTIFNILNR